MSNFSITLEVKPSPEFVALFSALIAGNTEAKTPHASTIPAPMPMPQPPRPASPVTPAPGYPQQPQYPAPINPAQQYATPVNQPLAPAPQYTAPIQQAPVNPTPAPQTAAPVTTATPVALSQPVPMPYPSNPAPAPQAAPTAATPGYTFDDLARAGSTLMDAGKQQDLLGLIGQFGIQSIQQLPKERYGEFATALRQMGARI